MSFRRWLANVRIQWFMVLALSALSPTVVWAGGGFQPVLPEELQMKAEPQSQGAAAIILYRQVDRDDRGAHTAHEDNYVRIKIFTEEGRKYGDVEIPVWKDEGNVVNIHARTIKPDGSIVNFDGKVFEKTIAKAKGLKFLAKTFTLPEVQPGCVIEYYYTIDFVEHYLYDSHWILSDELFTKSAKFSLMPYSSDDNHWKVRWSWQGLPPGTDTPKEGPDHIIRLASNNIPAFQTEDFMPPENELKARVDFVYSTETLDTDAARFWKSEGKKLNDQVESFVNKRKTMEEAVAQIVSPSDSGEVKLQKLYARVQQLRNTTYEIRKTEQEEKRAKEKDAGSVEDVWKRGYGNAIEITWLYLGLVRAAGFEASGVWASERKDYFFHPGAMDPRKLPSNVVAVKLDGKEVYCDPGAAFAPYGLLTWPETGTQALKLDKDGGTWVVTPLPASSASLIERKATLKLTDTGDIEGKLTITLTGLEAMVRRVEERHADETERKKFLEDQVQEYIPAASEVELTNKPEWKDTAVPMVAEYNVKIQGWAAAAGRRALVTVGIFSGTEKRIFDHANRVHPIYFEFPFAKVDDVTIDLPLDWQVTSVPPSRDSNQKVIAYALKVESAKGTLHLNRKLSVDVLMLDAKYYPALRSFFQEVRTGDEEQIVLQPGAASASN